MELSRNSVKNTRKRKGLGCGRHFLCLGVAFDTVGATMLFTGVFTDLLFYDLLLYLGSIIFFFSLLWWVFWYTGKIELTPEEALNRPYRVASGGMVDAPSNSFSFTIHNVPTTVARIERGQRCRSTRQHCAFLSIPVAGQVQEEVVEEHQDEEGMKSVEKSDSREEFGRGALGTEPEAVRSSEGVCAPGHDAGPLDTKAGRPSTHLV